MLGRIPQNWGWHHWTSHLFLVSRGFFKPTKMEREVSCLFCVSEVSCLFCVSEVTTLLVTSYYGRQSIAKLTAQPYDNWLAADYFVTYSPVSIKLINVFSFLIYFLISLGTLSTSEQLKHIRFCIACSIEGFSSVFAKHKNHFFATMCWDKVRPSC